MVRPLLSFILLLWNTCAFYAMTMEHDLNVINDPRDSSLVQYANQIPPIPVIPPNAQQLYAFEEVSPFNFNTSGVTAVESLAEFTPEYLDRVFHTDRATDSIIAVAKEIFNEIHEHRRFLDILSGREVMSFPVGIRKQFSQNSSLTVGVMNARFHGQYAEVDLFARLELSELNADLFFAAAHVKLSHKGGIYEQARLHLVKDFPVIQEGGHWLLTFMGGLRRNGAPTEESYMVIDCEGNVQELSLAADIRLSKQIAVPLKKNGEYAYPDQLSPSNGSNPVNNKSYVGAQFMVQANTANDFIFNLNLPLFEFRGLKGWGFQFKDCTLDLSDTRNIPGLRFPPSYTENGFLIRGQRELWRGFYASEVAVMLPREFRVSDTDDRIIIGANDFIIDNHGVSGDFFAENVITLNKGTAGGWRFSVDRIRAAIAANTFTGAGFSGSIILPVSSGKAKNALPYEAFISPHNEYLLDVGVDKDIDFDVFRARAKIFKGSFVRMEVENSKFFPQAHLTGVMDLDGNTSASLDTISASDVKKTGMEKLDLQGLQFQNLRLNTKAPPYLEVDYLALRDTVRSPSFFGFELGVHDVYLQVPDEHSAILGFNTFINLDDSGIKGDVGLRITASLTQGDLMRWNHDSFLVDSVAVSVRRKNFELEGSLYFTDEHEQYGDALSGQMRLYSESLEIQVGARAMFGKSNGLKYWYVDAYGAPRATGNQPFKVYSISGGLYHHMKKSGYDRMAMNPSGILYEPDASTSLGFKAMAAFEVKKAMTFSGLTGIEMSFNTASQGGGIRRIGFYGAASLMNNMANSSEQTHALGDLREVQEIQSNREAQLASFHELSIDQQGIRYFATEVFPDLLTGKELFAAQVAIDYDLSNKVYWGLFDAFLDLGGIRGDGEKNRLGYVEFYSAPDNWYVYAGTPDRRFGVRDIPVGPFRARANLYYMTGTQLPPPASPPPHIADMLNLQGTDLELNRSYTQNLAEGKGYAFGASFALGVGFDWGLVYANVEAGVGFDLMMKNFGNTACRGDSGPIGMNGWYASGQAYAYLQGSIGVRIDVFFMNMDIPVLRGGMALLAQAELPNPWFIKGYAGLELQVLGHIRIKTRVKVVIGEPCELTEKQALEGVTMISDVNPQEDGTDVNVFETVNVALNVPEGELLRVETLSGKKYYKALLDTLVVYNDKKKLAGTLSWNQNRDLLTWSGNDILPERKELLVWVKLNFMEYENGVWQPVYKDGVQVYEERKITFKTGDAPSSIPFANIATMYPAVDQQYVLTGEFEKGYIQLKKGQDYLFNDGLDNRLIFVSETGARFGSNLTYDKTNNLLRFDLPELQGETRYTFKWMAGAVKQGSSKGASVYENSGNALEVSANKIQNTSRNDAVFTRLEFSFTSSRYATFKEKVRAQEVAGHSLFTDGDHDVAGFVINTREAEPWDIHDLAPARYNGGKPLIRVTAHMTDDYYEKEIAPLLYDRYPLEGHIRFSRDTTVYGFVPVRAVLPSAIYTSLAKSAKDHSFLRSQFPFQWRLARTYKEDFTDLQQQLVATYLNGPAVDWEMFAKYKHLINGVFPYVNTEKYKVYFSYILPYRTTGNRVRVDYQNTF